MLPAHIASWALKREKPDAENRVGVEIGPTSIQRIHEPHDEDEQPVLQSKGGGTYIPPQPTPQEQAAARDWEAQQEFNRQERRDAAERARIADEKAAALSKWQGGRMSAYNAALQSGASRLQSLGIESGDPYGVTSEFNQRINAANAGLTDLQDYSSAFAPTVLDEVLGSARTRQRNKYKTAFNTSVSPYYAEDMFGSTADDAILNSILSDQYNQAVADLGAARDRGQASQAVYDRALRDLGTARSTANTELQSIGQGILTSDIDAINRRRQSALDTAAGWDFGDVYDPGAESERVRRYAGETQAGLEGAIRGAVGGREFFDVPGLIGKAAAKVGNQTTGTTTGTGALYDTFQNEAQRQDQSTRTNEGIF